jgi:hypothetical protein
LRRTFSRLIKECGADDKLCIKEFWRQFNIKMPTVILSVFVTRGDPQERTRVTCKPLTEYANYRWLSSYNNNENETNYSYKPNN